MSITSRSRKMAKKSKTSTTSFLTHRTLELELPWQFRHQPIQVISLPFRISSVIISSIFTDLVVTDPAMMAMLSRHDDQTVWQLRLPVPISQCPRRLRIWQTCISHEAFLFRWSRRETLWSRVAQKRASLITTKWDNCASAATRITSGWDTLEFGLRVYVFTSTSGSSATWATNRWWTSPRSTWRIWV